MMGEEFGSGMTDGLKRQRVFVKLYQFNYQYFNAYKRDFFKKSSQKSLEVKKKAVLLHPQWDGSSVGLERMLDRHEVTSSILVRPTRNALGRFFVNGGTLAQLV